MQGANLGATKQSKFFADPELTEISMRLYVPLLENDQHRDENGCINLTIEATTTLTTSASNGKQSGRLVRTLRARHGAREEVVRGRVLGKAQQIERFGP